MNFENCIFHYGMTIQQRKIISDNLITQYVKGTIIR